MLDSLFCKKSEKSPFNLSCIGPKYIQIKQIIFRKFEIISRFALKINASGPLVATREITGLSSRSWAPLLPALSAEP